MDVILKSGTEYSGFKAVGLQKWSLRFATGKYKIEGKYLKPFVKLAAKESKSGIDHIGVGGGGGCSYRQVMFSYHKFWD